MPIKPFYSIIIPTYNRASIVHNTVQQLKLQSFLNWECIVVDDGSTDNTKDIFEELSKNDNRINYIYQQNSERSIARNNGASIAKGEYFIFLDSDDEFELNHLELLYKHIIDSNCMKGMYFTNGKIKSTTSIQPITNLEIPNKLPLDYFINNSVIPARACLHHTIFTKLSFDPRAIIVEDTVLWTEIHDIYPIQYIPIDTVVYNWHEENSVNIKKFNAYKKRLIGLKILFFNKSVGNKIDPKTKDKHLNRCYIGIAQFYAYQNKNFNSKFWILISLLKYPHLDIKHKIGLLLNGFDFNKS